MRVAIIGVGAIGSQLLAGLEAAGGELVALLLRPARRANPPSALAGLPLVDSVAGCLEAGPRLVVEAAGAAAVAEHGPALLEAGIDLMIASCGALADPALEGRLRDAAAEGGARILIPSGAIGALDALGAMRLAGLDRVRYRGSKPPAAWAGSAAERAVDLGLLDAPAVFFRGSAREAARLYPKNANVAAAVAFAGLGLDATEVELVADPAAEANIHEIVAEGRTGSLALRMAGRPSAGNARTSALTAFSILAALRNPGAAIMLTPEPGGAP
ncbi:MAG: aspartate dehydrogenase [Dongiaceae bacterium]